MPTILPVAHMPANPPAGGLGGRSHVCVSCQVRGHGGRHVMGPAHASMQASLRASYSEDCRSQVLAFKEFAARSCTLLWLLLHVTWVKINMRTLEFYIYILGGCV